MARWGGTEGIVGRVAVARAGRNAGVRAVCGGLGDALARGVGTEPLVGRVAVAKTGRNTGVRAV